MVSGYCVSILYGLYPYVLMFNDIEMALTFLRESVDAATAADVSRSRWKKLQKIFKKFSVSGYLNTYTDRKLYFITSNSFSNNFPPKMKKIEN